MSNLLRVQSGVRASAVLFVLYASTIARAEAQEVRLEHVVVSYSGISQPHAQALARTVEAARRVADEEYGFDMPRTISISVTVNPKSRARLFNDGADTFSLTLRSEKDLRKPAASGIFHLYGLCHEVAHLAMYRPIADHGWLTTAGAEGWAHYLGSQIVDRVYEREGPDLWPDRYAYNNDGVKRLQRQLEAKSLSPTVLGARLWQEFADIVGKQGAAPVFAAWGKAKIRPTHAGEDLLKVMTAAENDPRLLPWWKKAAPVLVFEREQSGFAVRTIKPGELIGQPRELSHDDGKPAGKRSSAGSGHAVRFQVPDNSWCLTSVRIFGSRYGRRTAPKENFHVWLCDRDFKVIADLPFPYSRFKRGKPEWVTLRIGPTHVPQHFIICAGFNPSATKGVFMSHDAQGSGSSISGLPGRKGRTYTRGDWMIRAKVDQRKSADALRSEKRTGR